jgi:hypothetical protein
MPQRPTRKFISLRFGLLVTVVFVTFNFCKKDKIIYRLNEYGIAPLPKDSNPEMRQMYDEMTANEFEVAINEKSIYGESGGDKSIIMRGKTDPDDEVEIELDGKRFRPGSDGQWSFYDGSFQSFPGRQVSVRIFSKGELVRAKNLYFPKASPATLSGINYNLSGITRTGHSLHWNPDPENPVHKNLLWIGQEPDGNYSDHYYLIDDNGNYAMDDFLSDRRLKRFEFQLISFAAISARIGSRKLLFSFESTDYHEYEIVD